MSNSVKGKSCLLGGSSVLVASDFHGAFIFLTLSIQVACTTFDVVGWSTGWLAFTYTRTFALRQKKNETSIHVHIQYTAAECSRSKTLLRSSHWEKEREIRKHLFLVSQVSSRTDVSRRKKEKFEAWSVRTKINKRRTKNDLWSFPRWIFCFFSSLKK